MDTRNFDYSLENEQFETTQPVRHAEKSGMKHAGPAAVAAASVAAGAGAAFAVGQIFRKNATVADDASRTAGSRQESAPETTESPKVVAATDESTPVAHVDDGVSFSEAFAAARAQVGAGGVFEWHGKLYGTYYETEWESMSQEERARWQVAASRDVTTEATSSATAHTAETTSAADYTAPESSPAAGESTADANNDDEVHVVGVAVSDNGYGGMATIAKLQIEGEAAVVVDVDTDGTIDIVGIDENHNGQIEMNEWHDAREANVSTADIVGAYVAEAQEQGEPAMVTNLNDGSSFDLSADEARPELTAQDDDPYHIMQQASYDFTADDMPDYTDGTDAGIMDA